MDLLDQENVIIREAAADWKDAIRISVKPLEERGFVEPEYKEAIIANVEALGAYIIIAPHVALPHARPEQGVIKSQLAVTLFRKGVKFENKETPVKLFIVLAAENNDSHLETLVMLSEILKDEGNVEKMISADSAKSLYQYFI